ncbi:LysR family transcriptional regulator [Kurthia sibirica]|uniref:LysR family transcriptional regulator n=1 Tax=Kurthia sibirica TaxID=202750 RepID=UPI001168898D|nr:LysR family transcriptional regulator [Kurthia sibirica]GEK34620.1 HTH-type transcriptional regulator CitR [Kurthia sibirica]
MEYRWIQTFIVAAEYKNFRIASEKLNMSQPSITVHIKQLEKHLNAELFKRENNRVNLTEAGKVFLIQAKRIATQWETSLQLFDQSQKGIIEKCAIAMTPMMVETILPNIVYEFINEHPEYEISITIEESEKIEELIEAGDIQLGIGLVQPVTKRVMSHLFVETPLQLAYPLDEYDDESGIVYEIDELFSKYPLFTGHNPMNSSYVQRQVEHHFPASKQIQLSHSYAVKKFIRDGLGIAFLPKLVLRKDMMEGRLNIYDFHTFELPVVSLYFLYKNLREIDHLLIEAIKSRHFS